MEQNCWLPVLSAAMACLPSAVTALCWKTMMETQMLLWIVSIAEEQLQSITLLRVERSHNQSTFYFLDKMQWNICLHSNIQQLTVMVRISFFFCELFFSFVKISAPFLSWQHPNHLQLKCWHYLFFFPPCFFGIIFQDSVFPQHCL